MLSDDQSLAVETLLEGYRHGRFSPPEILELILARIDAQPDRHIWISRLSHPQLQPYLQALTGKSPDELPLYGIPFAIKDNIDLAGLPTTAACPDYAYEPQEHAFVVQRLIEAGALPIGKTNLDQFATGLNGTRSPWGPCRNSFDPDYVSYYIIVTGVGGTVLVNEPYAETLRALAANGADEMYNSALAEAIAIINEHPFGNGASIYTQNGSHARKFKLETMAGMIGVNVGIPAPVAPLPFGGMKASIFCDIKAQGKAVIDFYTEPKIITERYWPED